MSIVRIKASHPTSVKSISPFRYPGGKSWLTPQILLWLSYCDKETLFEPFAGGASVGLYALMDGLVDTLFLNEIDKDIYNFWVICINNSEEICEMIEDFKPEEDNVRKLMYSWKYKQDVDKLSDVEKAFMTLLRNRVARNGVMTSRSGFLKTGDRNGIFSRWYPKTMINRIRRVAYFKEAIVLSNLDGTQELRSKKYKNSAIFIDPPYIEAGKHLYSHNIIDHEKIFEFASVRSADVLITYDKSEKVVELSDLNKLKYFEMDMMSGGNCIKTELIISKSIPWIRGIYD